MIKRAASDFSANDGMTLAAALAFYAALSLAPLILLLIWVGGLLGPDNQRQLVSQVESYVGEQAGETSPK
jgi:membrane protein